MKILIVDDDRECCDELGLFILSLDHSIKKVYSGIDALYEAKTENYDIIISDVSMPILNGIELVAKLHELNVKSQIILISGQLEIVSTINAIELGIYDFLTKPLDITLLANMLSLIEKDISKKKNIKDLFDFNYIEEFIDKNEIINIDKIKIGEGCFITNPEMGNVVIFSEKIKNIFKKISKLYEYPEIPILIEGETGTGKEIIARSIHFESSMRENPFIGLNCSAIPKDMFEAELFGYEGGAFTGANPKGNSGKIALAGKGSLFLDEITEISLDVQVKLLRILQEKEYYKLSGHKKMKVECRIICATNKKIEEMVAKGLFREDLYYRLSVCKVVLPPLRQHTESIIPLVFNFIKKYNKKFNKKVRFIESKALKLFSLYQWQGNIRELENIIISSIIDNDSMITAEYINEVLNLEQKKSDIKNEDTQGDKYKLLDFDLPDTAFNLEELNVSIVQKVLNKFSGNKSKTAAFLGLSRNQMYRRFRI